MRSFLMNSTALFAPADTATANKTNGNGKRVRRPQSYKDMDGNPVSNDKDIATSFREMVDADYESDDTTKELKCELSDDDIVRIVKEHDPSDNEAIVEALKDADQADSEDEPTEQELTAGRMERNRAIEAAKVISKETLTFLRSVTEANERLKIAPFVARERLLLDAGKGDPEAGHKVLAMYPEPGSTKDTSNNPDKYTYQDKNEKGEKVTRRSSFYADMWDTTEDGAVQLAEISKIDYASKNPTPTDADKQYAAMHPRERRMARGKWTQRRNASINTIRKAVRLEHQLNAVSELCDKVEVYIARKRDKDGNETNEILNTSTPIIVGPKGAMFSKDSEPISLQSFLNMKPKVAGQQGGTFAALKATNTRAPKPGAADQNQLGDKTKLDINTKQAEAYLSAIVLQLTTSDDFNSEFGRWLNGPGSDEHVKLLGDAYMELGNWFKRVQKRYDDILENENTLTTKEREARKATGQLNKTRANKVA